MVYNFKIEYEVGFSSCLSFSDNQREIKMKFIDYQKNKEYHGSYIVYEDFYESAFDRSFDAMKNDIKRMVLESEKQNVEKKL